MSSPYEEELDDDFSVQMISFSKAVNVTIMSEVDPWICELDIPMEVVLEIPL